jgi:hypothetical protein
LLRVESPLGDPPSERINGGLLSRQSPDPSDPCLNNRPRTLRLGQDTVPSNPPVLVGEDSNEAELRQLKFDLGGRKGAIGAINHDERIYQRRIRDRRLGGRSWKSRSIICAGSHRTAFEEDSRFGFVVNAQQS